MRLLQRLLLPLAALLLAGPAAASTLSFSLSFLNSSGGTSTWNGSQAGTVSGTSGTQETFVGQQVTSGWALGWNVTANTDPFVNGFFSIQNNTAVTQTYSFTVSLPVAPPVAPFSTIGGSIGITVTDANGDGVATAASVGSGYVFNAANDGTTTLQLLPSFSLSAPFAGGSATASASAGLPGATISSIAANGTISITHTFTLTPGDSIGLTSFYQVSSVPEPGTLALFGAGAAGLLAIGRRRTL